MLYIVLLGVLWRTLYGCPSTDTVVNVLILWTPKRSLSSKV